MFNLKTLIKVKKMDCVRKQFDFSLFLPKNRRTFAVRFKKSHCEKETKAAQRCKHHINNR